MPFDKAKYLKEWRSRNPEKIREYRDRWNKSEKCAEGRKRRAGSLQSYVLLAKKNGIKDYERAGSIAFVSTICEICGDNFSKSRKCMDHCHATGKFRGILCQKCNSMLGLSGDNSDILEKAILYLKNNHP